MLGNLRRFLLTLLPIVIIAATLLVDSFRNNHGDFGNVPEVAGYSCWEEITDCEGDTDLLTIDAIDWSRSVNGSLIVRTTPAGHMLMTSVPTSEVYSESAIQGIAEKKVSGKWISAGMITVSSPGFVGVPGGGGDAACHILPNEDSFWRELRVKLPEYDPGSTYRLTYYFCEIAPYSPPSDVVKSVTHTVKLPSKTNKRFDFISLGLSGHYDNANRICPEIRVNQGLAPYMLLEECGFEVMKGGKWQTVLRQQDSFFKKAGDPVFEIYGELPTVVPEAVEGVPSHYKYPDKQWGYSFRDLPAECRLTLVFCDNSDGSGERYTLTLYLNTELLKECAL